MALAAGLSSKKSAGVSQKSNESADTALSQRSNRPQNYSKRLAGGGGDGSAVSNRVQASHSIRIQKRENNGRRSSTSEHSETDEAETPAKLNFCVLVGDVGSGNVLI